MLRFTLLALTLSAVLTAQAQDAASKRHHDDTPKDLSAVEVKASPLAATSERLALPVELLTGEALDAAKAGTLGDTVSKLPGVQSANFGPGVGRPIIRGLDGARVQVLSDGLGSGDVSTVSVDHAVSIEPFLADQIEVLKGPATLLYGSGAIGGAVNVVDGRIPDRLPGAPLSGRAELRGSSGSHERTGMLRLDGRADRLALHFDALHREAGDVRIPGFAESAEHRAEESEPADTSEYGHLNNSALRTDSAALGMTLFSEHGFLGGGYSLYRSTYGIPGHAHGHAHGDDGDDNDAEDSPVRIHMDQHRSELRGGLDAFGPFQSLRVKLADTQYTHTEFEGEAIGTVFNNHAQELRAELVHQPIAGWDGAIGLQTSRRTFAATGDEAFVPSSNTKDAGLFWLGKRLWGAFQLDLGLRADHNQTAPDTAQRARRFTTHSASLGVQWQWNPLLHFSLGFDRAQRAPTAEELFSSGLHVATGSFEFGHTNLNKETATRVELGAHLHHGPLEASVSVWRVGYADFIYLAGTDAQLENAPLRLWQQGDARFHGVEAKLDWDMADNASGFWQLGLFADSVRARLNAAAGSTLQQSIDVFHEGHYHHVTAQTAVGGYLPRIAPGRIGGQLRWSRETWRASLGAVHSFKQTRVAEFETTTPGYTLMDAHLAWHHDLANGSAVELFADVSNLTNQEARPHTSFLKDVVPLAGRSIAFGVRAFF